MAGLPSPLSLSLSAGGGGPSGADANNGIFTPISNPFNFDQSGWIVNMHGNGNTQSASGNKDANTTTQQQPGSGVAGLLGGVDPLLIGVAVIAYLLLK